MHVVRIDALGRTNPVSQWRHFKRFSKEVSEFRFQQFIDISTVIEQCDFEWY